MRSGRVPDFGVSVNAIATGDGGWGTNYAHRITSCPPGFENPTASLILIYKKQHTVKDLSEALILASTNPQSVLPTM